MDRMTLDHTHEASAQTWLEAANQPDSPFPLQNLPFARILRDSKAHVVVGLGDQALDLSVLEAELPVPFLREGRLDGLAFGDKRRELRHWLFAELQNESSALRNLDQAWLPLTGLRHLLPFEVGDYTDFYASIHHATRVGAMFRPDNPLLPNYRWVPIGYHGRASSLIVSGTPVRRPSGQLKADDAEAPVVAPCKLLDYELELGLWVGKPNMLGEPISMSNARDHWIGVSLVNDWSARDIQKWEYQPLGPFLAKSFATSVSPWVVTQEALAPFAAAAMTRDPAPLPYLLDANDQDQGALDLELEVWYRTAAMTSPHCVSKSNPKDLYWTLGQMLVHHASNGCPMRTGDLLASGTISGPEPESAGCLLELTWQGPGLPRKPVQLTDTESRTFLLDGDEITLTGWGRKLDFRSIGLGSCSGVIQG